MPDDRPRFAAASFDDIPAGFRGMRHVRDFFGIEAFGSNGRIAERPGDVLVVEHDELAGGPQGTDGHEEMYIVLRGRAAFTLDGEEVQAPAGTLLFVRDPAVRRSAVAIEPGTAVLGVGGPPGRPFRTARWEWRYLDHSAP